MKRILIPLMLLASFKLFAQDYTCYVSEYKLEFKAQAQTSELTVRDRYTGEFVFVNMVDRVQEFNDQTQFHFDRFIMTFKTESLNQKEDKLFGFADGTFGRGFVNTTLRCIKNETNI